RWGTGVAWTPTDQTAVENGDAPSSCVTFTVFRSLFTPADETGQVPTAAVYNAQTNPSGVRGTLWDYSLSQLGRRRGAFVGARRTGSRLWVCEPPTGYRRHPIWAEGIVERANHAA